MPVSGDVLCMVLHSHNRSHNQRCIVKRCLHCPVSMSNNSIELSIGCMSMCVGGGGGGGGA